MHFLLAPQQWVTRRAARRSHGLTRSHGLLQEAKPGLRSHGTVTGVQEYGVFIGFYGSVSGLAPAAELGLAAAQKPADVYELGQVLWQLLTWVWSMQAPQLFSCINAHAQPANSASACAVSCSFVLAIRGIEPHYHYCRCCGPVGKRASLSCLTDTGFTSQAASC